MTDDLVERLQLEAMCSDYHVDELNEAANRIEQLEKGFRDILESNEDALIMSFIARACLNGAIDAQGRYCYVPFSALEKKKDD
jgi:hypothetical protein